MKAISQQNHTKVIPQQNHTKAASQQNRMKVKSHEGDKTTKSHGDVIAKKNCAEAPPLNKQQSSHSL
jgi:hypothetical protein